MKLTIIGTRLDFTAAEWTPEQVVAFEATFKRGAK